MPMGPKLLVHWLSTREQTDPQTLELDVDRYIANIDTDGEPLGLAVHQHSVREAILHSVSLQLARAACCCTGTRDQPCRGVPPAPRLASAATGQTVEAGTSISDDGEAGV